MCSKGSFNNNTAVLSWVRDIINIPVLKVQLKLYNILKERYNILTFQNIIFNNNKYCI